MVSGSNQPPKLTFAVHHAVALAFPISPLSHVYAERLLLLQHPVPVELVL